jgi:hypothetical protein
MITIILLLSLLLFQLFYTVCKSAKRTFGTNLIIDICKILILSDRR